ncbi:MAG: hypothetical protein CDV28_14111 [Candidatus Electronema aureum]|uniref:DUF5666 domain-containing protein n=1 Tax=Candidatus Electronema aureum TaxID=2005002 RepID=A0A521FZ77_9BACT|nr:MAG: hypothetical protein CDV28_14111 [Candidatus Electronema aureum]
MKRAFFLLAAAITLSAGAAEASRHEYGYGYGYGRGYGYESRAKFYGTVDAMPQTGFNGVWMVNGRQVMITPSTRIKEKYARLALGSYVEVEGYHSNGGFTAYEVEVKGGRQYGYR